MDINANRRYVIYFIIGIVFLSILIQLFYIQIIDKSYEIYAENNSKRVEIIFPPRGLIYDRNNNLLVNNQIVYDLMIAPYELKPFDTTELCVILNISKEKLREGIKKAYFRRRDPFLKQLPIEKIGILLEKLYRYPGFYLRPRTIRVYNKEIASHLLGYIGEVDEKILVKDSSYIPGEYIGINGIEKSYEKYLRGKKGQKLYLVDAYSRIVGPYYNGKYDVKAEKGKNIVCTIDSKLQEYGEKLMKNLKGSIVAIEPSTGEILAFVSAPTYNPSLLSGENLLKNYPILKNDSLQPLFNRPLMAGYPPGSTFKIVNGIIALNEKLIDENTSYGCPGGYYVGRVKVGCHSHSSPLNFTQAIQNSCNTYFCNVFRKILDNKKYSNIYESYKIWKDYASQLGFGKKLNIDLPNESPGNLPSAEYYDRYFGKNRWNSLTIISLAIGQGEILATPLQMANLAAIIANRGYYYIPHVVKKIENKNIDEKYRKKIYTNIDTSVFEKIIKGMYLAVNGGPGSTAGWVRLENIEICGKTGTAQNPHGEDHSVFIAFAPKNNPKIAISVYVEHGKWGATFAAPIASLMIEKYLTDTITRPWMEEKIINSLIKY